MDTGTGLGLWVVSQLLERRKGCMRVWSSQRANQCGTVFSVFLPFLAEVRSYDGDATHVEEVLKASASQFLEHQDA
jgi:nitrogen-specific signal transduction histidine kinase